MVITEGRIVRYPLHRNIEAASRRIWTHEKAAHLLDVCGYDEPPHAWPLN